MHRIVILAVLGACGFSNEAPPDAPSTLTVGFAGSTSMADEKSTGHPIDVLLSGEHTSDIVVTYEVVGGTATPIDDFDTSVAMVTIPAGMLKATIIIPIKPDVIEEGDETIQLALSSAPGATIPAETRNHEVKILAKALPRASFGVASQMTSAQEPMDPVINVSLDEASEFPITVSYTVTPMGASNLDYTLADGSVMFAPGELSRGIPLDILDDVLDEDSESIEIKLTTATNAFVELTADTARHTILDNLVDPQPTVQFTVASSSIGEAGGTANIQLTLSAVSGRTIMVPFTVDGASSATGTADYTIASMVVTINPGQLTANAQVTIVDDTIDDEAEIVELDLATATNATIQGRLTHQLTITDDDNFCLGANADIDVCFPTAPGGSANLSGTINTDTDTRCEATQPIGWTPTQDAACVIARGTLNVNGATTVTGTRPLVLFATTNLSITANLNAASAQGGNTGPGTSPSTCNSTGPENDADAGGGGAGGSFLTIGGNGGTGDNTDADAGMAAAAVTAPTKLRPGCPGQKGGNSQGNQGGAPGGAGGALYLIAGNTLSIGAVAVNVSGAGGSPSDQRGGGGGGGSGGMLVLFSGATQTLNNNTILVANGGGGSGGGTGSGGSAGQDPLNPTTYDNPAPGGAAGGAGAGDGGSGFAIGDPAVAGFPGTANNGGGGGGGGGGYILSNRAFGGGPNVSAGLIVP